MKQKLSEISGYFKIEKLKNDKRIIVFLVCLLIATTLWFLNALSQDFSTTLSYPVKYINPPKNQFLANEPPSKLELKVNAHGFTLLRNKLNFSFSPLLLDLNSITNNIEPSLNGYRINSNALLRRISNQVSSEISVNSIQPEFFFIRLDSLKSKLVPVKPNIEINFKPQFHLKAPVHTHPDKVKITGPSGILDTIFFLRTEQRKFEELDNDLVVPLKIIHPEHTAVSFEKTELTIETEKFTEKELLIPIEIENSPENAKVKLFPSEIKVTVLVGLSEFEKIDASTFDVFVDMKNSETEVENIAVSVQSKLPGVQIIRYAPQRVEYLVETK